MRLARLYMYLALLLASVSDSPYVLNVVGAIGQAAVDAYFLFGAVLAAAYVLMTRKIIIPAKYALLFFLLLLHVVSGIILNDVDEGVVVGGIRTYFKYIPLFLIPAIFWSEGWKVFDNKVLLIIALTQLPAAVLQRFVFFAGGGTGDVVRGTAATGSMMSIFLLACIVYVVGRYLAGKMSGARAAFLSLVLFLPITLAEVKATLVLVVVCIIGFSSAM